MNKKTSGALLTRVMEKKGRQPAALEIDDIEVVVPGASR